MASIRLMCSRMACWRKSGVVSISTQCPSYCSITEGRVLWSCGSLDVHTRQVQPMVGTPIDVPLPRTVRTAFIFVLVLRWAAAQPRVWLWHCQFNPGHPQLKQHVLEHVELFVREIALCFVVQYGERVNGLPRANDIHPGLVSLCAKRSHLDQCAHVKRLDDLLKGHFRIATLRAQPGLEDIVKLFALRLVLVMLRKLLFHARRFRHLIFGRRSSRLCRLCGLSLRRRLSGRFCRRLRCRFFFFFNPRARKRFTFSAKTAAITYNKIMLLFSHTSSNQNFFATEIRA